MGKLKRCIFAIAAFVSGAAAAAQDPAEGLYIVERMETGSQLELAPEGRFRWIFVYGAVDLMAEGRWRRDGEAILLDTEPAVQGPSTALVGTDRQRGRAVTVRITDAEGNTPEYLTIEGAYESGEPDYARFGEDYAFEPERGRRIVAIRVIIPWAGYVSESFPLPQGANVMRLRFAPNDLGRVDFRGERLTAEADALILNLFDEPLRYRRVTAEELAAERQAEEDMASGEGDSSPADDEEPVVLSEEQQALDAACVNEGNVRPRAEAIAGCTALLEPGSLAPQVAAIVHVNRGNLLMDDGQEAAAMADYEAAIRLNPQNAMAYWGRAVVRENRGDYARAAADSRVAAAYEPENPTLLNSLCWHLALAGEALEDARAACDRSLELGPDDPDTLDSRGLLALKQGRFAEAWADFDAAVRHGADSENLPNHLFGRGIAALRLGRTAEGQADLARASAQDPAIADTYARYGVRR